MDEFVKGILRDWLKREMSDISEEYWCASWLIGLEHTLWLAIEQLPDCGQLDPKQLEKLKHVAELIGEWIVWDDKTEETAIPLDQWRERHKEWQLSGARR